MKEGDRGWKDVRYIEKRLPELAGKPVLLIWAPGDIVFPLEFANRLKELIPHAEGPVLFDKAAHFLQDDRGPDIAKTIVEFLDRRLRK
jgi:haloalkane dehalogenase